MGRLVYVSLTCRGRIAVHDNQSELTSWTAQELLPHTDKFEWVGKKWTDTAENSMGSVRIGTGNWQEVAAAFAGEGVAGQELPRDCADWILREHSDTSVRMGRMRRDGERCAT